MPDTAEPQHPLAATPPIEYEHPAGAFPRRQFRLLLILTFINTLLLAAFVCGPAISTFARTTWTNWQEKRQIDQKLQQQSAMLRQAETFTAPPQQVVYEENPIEAAKLANTDTFTTISVAPHNIVHITPQPWQPPVMRKMPPPVAQLEAALANRSGIRDGTLLLHLLKAPDGEERLIWIRISGEQRVAYPGAAAQHPSERKLFVRTQRRIVAQMIDKQANTPNRPLLRLDLDGRQNGPALAPITPGRRTEVFWRRTDTWENGTVEIHGGGLFRFYAGQLDPNDPSHFTIDYTLDGEPGTIDGYLKSGDKLVLIPRAGRIVDRNPSGDFAWDPFAAPATRPANP